MSYSRRQLYAMGEPLGDGATRQEVGGKRIYGGGGGSSGTQKVKNTSTQYTSAVPPWLQDEQQDIIARGLALAQQPYQAYTGERAAQFTPLQRQAYGAAEGQQVAGQLGLASGLAGLSGVSSFRDPGTAGSYMNPFLEQALAPQLQGLARQSQIEGTRQQGEATMRGAFGGSRDAIMRAEREKNLLSQQSDVLGRGYAQAFDTAQGQFNAERAAQMQAAGLLGQLGQQQFGQEMDIMGRQREFGADQQAQIQRILDQQYADFQAQRDFPYQQIGFMSDLIQGQGGSTRSMYSQPGVSPLQTIAGLGTAAVGLGGLMAKGGSVQRYADGGITGLLGDQELAQRAENPMTSPMGQLAAQQQMAENAALRAAAPQGLPQPMVEDTMDPVEAALVVEMQKAVNEGDRQRAVALAETIEKRREERMAQDEMGIAAVADDSIGEIPEGGITGMEPVMAAEGGELRFFNGGPIVLPAGTPRWMIEQTRMENPGVEVRSEDEGSKYRAVGQGITSALTYNSDVEAQRARNAAKAAAVPSNATDAMRNQSRTASRTAGQQRVPQAVPDGVIAPPGPGPAPDPMQQGIATAVNPNLLYGTFDVAKARQAQEKAIREGETAALGEVDAEQARYDAFIKSMGLRGEAEEKRIRESLEGIKGEKNQAKSMALFQAGLAILSADPSRGALAAIGQGAIQGLGAYKGDLKDLEARRERMTDKLDALDGLRRQEAFASEEGRQRIAQRRSQIRTDFAKEYRAFAKQFDVDIPLEAAKTLSEQTARMSQARIMADRSTEGERLRAELSKYEPGSKEYNRILADISAISEAQGAGKNDPISLERAKKLGEELKMVNIRLQQNIKDPTTRANLEAERRRLENEINALRRGGGSTGGAASGTVDANNPLLRS